MNLQVNSPFTPCPYKCPYCCAGFVNDISLFNDNGKDALCHTDKAEYLRRLHTVIDSMQPETIVITGSTEPTLFRDWLTTVINDLVYEKRCGNVEVTTRNGSFTGNTKLQAVSYSFHSVPKTVYTSWARHTRAVFILHDGIALEDIIAYHERSGGQTTVKNLAVNSYGNAAVNEWIAAHRVTLADEDIDRLFHAGIWYDRDCNNSEGRYRIFRADGNLYESWQAMEPMQIQSAGGQNHDE